jgi:hypothetical protein
MPNYILDGDERVSIADRPVAVTVGGRGDVVLQAHVGGRVEPTAQVRPDIVVLPRIVDRTVVRVVPGRGVSRFPDGTRVAVRVQTQQPPHLEADTVEVRAVDVSGESFRDFLAVERSGDQVTVTALSKTDDVELSDLGRAARAEAKACLGIDRTGEPLRITVTVDTSASMRGPLADGSVAAVVDMVTGVAQVIGGESPLEIALLADDVTRLPETPLVELAAATERALSGHGFGAGFRSVLAAGRTDGPTRTYVVTDAVPADAATLRAGHRRGDERHLVLLGAPGPGRAVPDGLPCTVLPAPPRGVPATEHVLRSPDLLAAVVGALVAPEHGPAAPGSPA